MSDDAWGDLVTEIERDWQEREWRLDRERREQERAEAQELEAAETARQLATGKRRCPNCWRWIAPTRWDYHVAKCDIEAVWAQGS